MYMYIYDVSGVIGMKCGVLVSGGERQQQGFSGVDCSASHELN
jgi:hypothetical protein